MPEAAVLKLKLDIIKQIWYYLLMVGNLQSAGVLLILLVMVGVVGWVVMTQFSSLDLSSKLSLRAFMPGEEAPASEEILADSAGSVEPSAIVKQYPVVQIPQNAPSVFAPQTQ
jgi:hypothetical protein